MPLPKEFLNKKYDNFDIIKIWGAATQYTIDAVYHRINPELFPTINHPDFEEFMITNFKDK